MIRNFTANLIPRKVEMPVEMLYFNSENTISEYKPLDPFFTFGCGKNPVDGYYYFATMSKGGPPLNRSHYVFKYDIISNSIVDQVHIPKSADITSSYDVHSIPTVQFDSSGNIYMVVEKCANSTGWSNGHVTDILIYKTATPGDLSTMSLWKTLPGEFSYPKLWINGSNLYMGGRGQRGSVTDVTKWTVEKSTDSGETWTDYLVCHLTGSPIKRAYFNTLMNFDGSDLTLVLNIRNEGAYSFESASFMTSPDGVNWLNAAGDFSKDVSIDGALTISEIEANMLIWKIDPAIYQVNFEGGCVKNGKIKILLSKSELSGIVVDANRQTKYVELRLYTFSDGSWTYKDVSQLLPPNYWHFWAYERTLQYVPSLSEDYIFVLDRRDLEAVKLFEYKSTNGFSSYSIRTVFEGAGNYYYGTNAFNSETQAEQLIILNDVQGTYDDFNDYSNLRIINP